MAVRKKSSAKTKAKRAVQKTKAAVKRTVSRAKAAAKRPSKKKRRALAVPEIEPPSPARATGKAARRVGHAPAATRRRGSPALSIAGGGIAVPRGR